MKKSFFFLLCFLLANLLFAQDTLLRSSVDEIMLLPVVQKEEETVTTASKKAESALAAPAIVSVINAKEITTFGANNLREVIERVVNVITVGSHLFPDNAVSVRGSLLSHYDNHVLLLLNGRPMREGLTGGVNSPIYLAFPISSIARIEIIRGPGSVLYGSNAFAGIINIITYESQIDFFDGVKIELSSMGGSFGTIGFSTNVKAKKENLVINAGSSFLRNEGWNFEMLDERKDSIRQPYGQQILGANFGLSYKKLTISALVSHIMQDNLGALPIKSIGTPNKNLKASRSFLDVGYDFGFSKNWTSKVNLTYNSFSENYFVGASLFNAFSNDLIAEVDNSLSFFSSKLSILLGGMAYLHTGGGYEQGVNNVPLYQQVWWSAYTQADWKIAKGLKIVAGFQANKPQDIKLDFVPRLGIIYNYNEKMGMKILYAQAFRSAFALERSLVAPNVLRGNPNLLPEKVNTLDLQIFRHTEKYQIAINYFQSQLIDIITRVPVPNSSENTYTNLGKLRIAGLELEGKIFPHQNIYLFASYGYNQNVLNDSIKNSTQMPEHSFKLGFSYSNKIINIGVFSSYFSAFGNVTTVRASPLELNPTAKAFTYLTTNLQMDLLKLIKSTSTQSLMCFVYITNLLDSRIYYPEFSRRRINTIPGRAGRSVQIGLRFKL